MKVAAAARVLTAAILSMAAAASAVAALVDRNTTYGYGTATLDTATGLEWLDVSMTWNLSWNAAQTTFASDGFRHASKRELAELFINAGLSVDTGTSASNYGPATDLQLLLSCREIFNTSTTPWSPQCHSTGFTDFDPVKGWVELAWIERDDALLVAVASVYTNNFIDGAALDTYAHPALGHWMVRSVTPIPEPSTWALLGLGLAGVGVSARWRRNRQDIPASR